ncbi:hypothetical protein TcWFU_002331 [Taenia crassiceps]|uniref:Uncharacterized protein n=1 Tax=Taenia crassiceps TaxID=6207 RepID=A0ABR4Q5I8_9CEST
MTRAETTVTQSSPSWRYARLHRLRFAYRLPGWRDSLNRESLAALTAFVPFPPMDPPVMQFFAMVIQPAKPTDVSGGHTHMPCGSPSWHFRECVDHLEADTTIDSVCQPQREMTCSEKTMSTTDFITLLGDDVTPKSAHVSSHHLCGSISE